MDGNKIFKRIKEGKCSRAKLEEMREEMLMTDSDEYSDYFTSMLIHLFGEDAEEFASDNDAMNHFVDGELTAVALLTQGDDSQSPFDVSGLKAITMIYNHGQANVFEQLKTGSNAEAIEGTNLISERLREHNVILANTDTSHTLFLAGYASVVAIAANSNTGMDARLELNF